MVKLVVIADDFTGALDTGVQFAKSAVKTLIVQYKDLDFSKIDESMQVVVVDTESRHISRDEAASRVKAAALKALDAGVAGFYKKTDSALRGNIGAELLAVMEATGSKELMFIPAYPDAGRTTVNGCQFINRIPIDETGFSRDPLDPVTHCYIPHIIKSQADVEVKVTGKDDMERVCASDKGGKTIYVFNAENNGDMAKIAEFLKGGRRLSLTAGCAGFANRLPDILELEKSREPEKHRIKGRMLTVCGSINEFSLQQVKYAENNNFSSLTLNTCHKLEHGFFKAGRGKEWIDRIVGMLDEGRDVIVKTIDSENDEENCRRHAQELQIDEDMIPYVISRNIGDLVVEVAARTELGTLVVFGGDTTAELVNSLGFYGVVPQDEILTGVVLSEALGNGGRVNLITKSGGFGKEDVLVKIKEYIDKYWR
jgi:uncharacterized protein YgbK (DUF1537 family)